MACQTIIMAALGLMVAGLLWTGCEASVSSDWGYSIAGDTGPDKWSKKYPDCGGVMQSPINIDTSKVVYDRNIHYFNTSDYGITDQVYMKLENVGGHTAEVHVSGTPLYISNGGLPAKYVLEQFHCHWGADSSRGSEHSIKGQFFPLEIHFVHRQERFESITAAAPKPFGLAVISIVFKVGQKNHKYDPLVENLWRISNANDESEIETFAVSDLFPRGNFDFYRYQGSLTTPPCSESVIWSVVTDPQEISEEQLEKFRALHDDSNGLLVNDFRPLQDISQRTVLTTRNTRPTVLKLV